MSNYEEDRRKYQLLMGADVGLVYHSLWNECALLHVRWEQYMELFGKDQEQFDVMNGIAPRFFKEVQDAWWERILLHLCRFGDNHTVAHRRTLSLDALSLRTSKYPMLNLPDLVSDAKTAVKFAQDWRHRLLAHKDLDHALDRHVTPLASASRVHVKQALKAIARVLDTVEAHFTGAELRFDGASHREGSYVLRELRLVKRLRAERWERMETVTARPDDLDWSKWR